MKNLAMLSSYFEFIFVHLRQKVRLWPELSAEFLLTFGPNPTQKARPDLQLCFAPVNHTNARAPLFGSCLQVLCQNGLPQWGSAA